MHQYLYEPDSSFVLVDIDPIIMPGREDKPFSFEGEILRIEQLVTDVRSMYKDDPAKLTIYTNKARALLLNSGHKNGMYVPEEVVDDVLSDNSSERGDISGNLELALRLLPQNKEYYRIIDERKKQKRDEYEKKRQLSLEVTPNEHAHVLRP